MTMKEMIATAKAKAAEALNAAKEIRGRQETDVRSEWNGEDQEAFKNAMSGFQEHHSQVVSLSEDEQSFNMLAEGTSEYLEPEGEPVRAPIQSGRSEEAAKKQKEAHARAFRRYLRGGIGVLTQEEVHQFVLRDPEFESQMGPEEMNVLLGTVDNLGGFAVTDDFQDELIRDIAGFAVIRPVARVRPTSSSAATFLTIASGTDPYPSGVSGSWRSEGYVSGGTAPTTQNQPTFGRERVPVHIWSPDVIELTTELLEDASVDLEAEIRTLLAETRGLDEDSGFINGSGVGQPEGITNAGLTTVQSGVANGQGYAGLVELYTGCPAQYRGAGKWLMNSLTYGLILVLEDTEGSPIFPTNQDIARLFGKDILFSEFMDDGDTDTNNAIIFGDFRQYGIADRMDLRIIRLVERYAPNVGLLAVARVGGQVLRTAGWRMQAVGT